MGALQSSGSDCIRYTCCTSGGQISHSNWGGHFLARLCGDPGLKVKLQPPNDLILQKHLESYDIIWPFFKNLQVSKLQHEVAAVHVALELCIRLCWTEGFQSATKRYWRSCSNAAILGSFCFPWLWGTKGYAVEDPGIRHHGCTFGIMKYHETTRQGRKISNGGKHPRWGSENSGLYRLGLGRDLGTLAALVQSLPFLDAKAWLQTGGVTDVFWASDHCDLLPTKANPPGCGHQQGSSILAWRVTTPGACDFVVDASLMHPEAQFVYNNPTILGVPATWLQVLAKWGQNYGHGQHLGI